MNQAQIEERLEQFFNTRRRGQVGFSVYPRYSGGSPAGVNMETAIRVALREQDEYASNLGGEEGREAQERAERMGLAHIVEARRELPKAWDILDLITGERRERPFSEGLSPADDAWWNEKEDGS
jgi:hypothetical protein